MTLEQTVEEKCHVLQQQQEQQLQKRHIHFSSAGAFVK